RRRPRTPRGRRAGVADDGQAGRPPLPRASVAQRVVASRDDPAGRSGREDHRHCVAARVPPRAAVLLVQPGRRQSGGAGGRADAARGCAGPDPGTGHERADAEAAFGRREPARRARRDDAHAGGRSVRGHADPHERGEVLPARDLDRPVEPRREAEPRDRAPAAAARAREDRPGRAQRLRVRARPRRGDHGVRLLMLALSGVSFLTPLDALFALAAAVPIAALAVAERRSARVRRLLSLRAPGRRAMLPVAIALVLLPALVAVAAAQPVVVRQQMVSERADAQAFVVFDTSLSMHASAGPGKPTRLARAKRIAIRLQRSLADVPMGIASMTDRALPNIMPTTDSTLFRRTVEQAIHVDEPPPSQQYRTRATTFTALVPLVESRFFAQKVQRRLVIVLTDGESTKI